MQEAIGEEPPRIRMDKADGGPRDSEGPWTNVAMGVRIAHTSEVIKGIYWLV